MAAKVFISYAYRDAMLVDDLKNHLRPLQRHDLLELWDDLQIAPGGEWNLQIDKHIREADIILLMISPDFLNSDYCYSVEMRQALRRHEQREALVIPIILRPVHWQATPFGNLQVLPSDALPVTKWRDRDEAFHDIVKGIVNAISIVPSLVGNATEASPGKPRNPPTELENFEQALTGFVSEQQHLEVQNALESAKAIVDTLQPGLDQAARAMAIQAILPDILRLLNKSGLEIKLPPTVKAEDIIAEFVQQEGE